MSETFATPDDLGDIRASELHSSLGERLGAQAGEAFMGGARTLLRIGEYGAAERGEESLTSQMTRLQAGEDLAGVVDRPQPPADIAIADAKARVKQEGLEGHFKLPDQPIIKAPVLDLMIQHAHDRRQYDAAVSRGPQGFLPGALGFVTELGAGIIDPVNIAAFSIPVVGEARFGMMVARAGESLASRAAVRAGVGAAQGAVGGALLAPGDWWLHTNDGVDYTMADALHSVIMGAGMGAAFHAGGGAFGDVRARMAGRPLPGSAEDLRARALAGDIGAAELLGRLPGERPRPGDEPPQLAPGPARDGTAADEVPGVSPGPEAQPTPALGELPAHPADGFTRFYHGGEYPTSGGGRWLTPDRAYAEGYASDRGVHYVDLPNDSPLLRKSFDDTGTDQRAPFVSFEAPAEIAAKLQPLDHPAAPHPAEVLADLPPRVREDAARAAIADVIDGNAVRVGEMLQEAAKDEPRIAESLGGAGVVAGPSAARGPRARPEETWSLNEFLAHRGGLDPTDPMIADVRSSLGRANTFVPGFGNLNRAGGMRLDRAREAAVEAGYLHDAGDRSGGLATSTINHLLEAIDGEARGAKVYRAGSEPPEKARDPEQYRHELNGAMEHALTSEGVELERISSKTRERTLDIMDREGVTDPLVAYERAVMEETHYGAEAGEHERIPEAIPGWDVPDDAGAAPGAGGAAAPGGQDGARPGARDAGAGDRAPPGAGRGAADWQRVRAARQPEDQDLAIASRQAEHAEEPASIDPKKAVSAAEKAAAEADALLADLMPRLTDEERAMFEDALNKLDSEKAEREQLVREGAACLAAAVA